VKENNKIVESLVDVSTHCDIFMKSKKMVCLIVVMLVVLIFGNSVQATDRQKGDINGDNKISITDISLLKLHLVGIKEIGQEHQIYADVSGDGKVNITDLSKLKIQFVGLGNRDLTSEELQKINEMMQRDSIIFVRPSNNNITSDSLSVEDIGILTRNVVAPYVENQFDYNQILQLHFGNNQPAGGDVLVCKLNDIQRMYKEVFDLDIERETLISKLGNSYHEEIDAITYQPEMAMTNYHYNIQDAYFYNGEYFINVTWYYDTTTIENSETIFNNEYERTGLLIMKKVDDRYCYVSYNVNINKNN